MISLSTGGFFERSARQIDSLRSRADKLQEQIGSGERLSRSSDDPVAAARLRTLSRSDRLAAVDQSTSDTARNDLKLTDQALGSMTDIINRAKELALQGATGTLNDAQRSALGIEIASLRETLLLAANSRNSAGHALFGGKATGTAYQNGATGPSMSEPTESTPSILEKGNRSRLRSPVPKCFRSGSTTRIPTCSRCSARLPWRCRAMARTRSLPAATP